jgi:hypothetical protein
MLSSKTNINVPTVTNNRKKLRKKLFFLGKLKATAKKSRIRIRIRTPPLWIRSPVYRSEDPNPDSFLNVTDPEHKKCQTLIEPSNHHPKKKTSSCAETP